MKPTASQMEMIKNAAAVLESSGYDAFVNFMAKNLQKHAAKVMGSSTSKRKAKSSAANGKLGGRPSRRSVTLDEADNQAIHA